MSVACSGGKAGGNGVRAVGAWWVEGWKLRLYVCIYIYVMGDGMVGKYTYISLRQPST